MLGASEPTKAFASLEEPPAESDVELEEPAASDSELEELWFFW